MNNYGFIPDPGEEILRIVHRSFIDLVGPLAISAVLIIAAAGLAFIAGRFPTTIPFSPLVTLALIIVMTILGAAILLIGFYTYKRNVLIFTNFHLVENEQNSLFSRQVSQIDLNQVQDASGQRKGFWATIFDYGDVVIQSAGSQEKFIFHRAPHPDQLADEALQRRDECRLAQQNGGAPTPSTPAP